MPGGEGIHPSVTGSLSRYLPILANVPSERLPEWVFARCKA